MKNSLLFSFGLIGQIGFSVSVPLVAFGIVGRLLDKKFDTGPYLFLLGLGFATVLVYFIIKQIVNKAIKQFNSPSTKETTSKKQ